MDNITISDATNGINFAWSSGLMKDILHNRIGIISVKYDAKQEDYKISVPAGGEGFDFFFKQVISPALATPQALVDQIRAWGEKII